MPDSQRAGVAKKKKSSECICMLLAGKLGYRVTPLTCYANVARSNLSTMRAAVPRCTASHCTLLSLTSFALCAISVPPELVSLFAYLFPFEVFC